MRTLLKSLAIAVIVMLSGSVHAAKEPVLRLTAKHAYVVNLTTGDPVIAKQEVTAVPIASLTKLMTALITTDAELNMAEEIEITADDLKATKESTRTIGLFVGTKYTREELLLLALMSSSNRAAVALARTHPLGFEGFVELMNTKARELGMYNTHFVDPSGLYGGNVSTAEDLVKLLQAVRDRPMIGRFSTETYYKRDYQLVTKVKKRVYDKKTKHYVNQWTNYTDERTQAFGTTNRLLLTDDWNIFLQKTGFTHASGYCMTMIVNVNGEDYAIVLLNATNKKTRAIDAIKAKYWVEYHTVPSKRVLSKLNPFRRVHYAK